MEAWATDPPGTAAAVNGAQPVPGASIHVIGAWVADLFRSSGVTDAEPASMGRTAVTDGIGFFVASRRGGRTSIGVLARRAPHWTAGSAGGP